MGVNGGGNFWGFLASISPFESWRKYIVFRHKRDQDHRFRDPEEARRLRLENDARELALLEKRIKIAKQVGATKEQLEPLCNRILGATVQTAKPIPPALPPKEPLLLGSGESSTPIDPEMPKGPEPT
jgi:hypothetical protein